MNFIRYTAPDGEDWRVEDGEKLLSDFGIPMANGKTELARWHQAFGGQEGFDILCRLYAINPMLGVTDPDLLRPLSVQEMASLKGMALREVDGLVEHSKAFWTRWKSQDDSRRQASEVDPVSERPAELDDSTVRRMLLENGFVNIENADERTYIANRIRELDVWLESEQSRAVARSLIQQEVILFFILDPAIAAVRSDMEAKKAVKHDTTKAGEQLLKLMKDRREQQSGIENTMKQLGMDEARNSTLKKKMSFKDTIGTLMDGIAKYYSDADHALIDLVFTAAEINLLTTPLTLRPQQYRPDVVASAHEAMKHFWERDYVPTQMGRIALRRLRAGFEQGLSAVRSESGESIKDMGEAGDDEAEVIAEEGRKGQPVDFQHAASAVPQPQPPSSVRTDDLAV